MWQEMVIVPCVAELTFTVLGFCAVGSDSKVVKQIAKIESNFFLKLKSAKLQQCCYMKLNLESGGNKGSLMVQQHIKGQKRLQQNLSFKCLKDTPRNEIMDKIKKNFPPILEV